MRARRSVRPRRIASVQAAMAASLRPASASRLPSWAHAVALYDAGYDWRLNDEEATAQRVIGQVSDQEKLFYRFLTIGLVPILIAVFGFTRMMRRRREEDDFLAAQGG